LKEAFFSFLVSPPRFSPLWVKIQFSYPPFTLVSCLGYLPLLISGPLPSVSPFFLRVFSTPLGSERLRASPFFRSPSSVKTVPSRNPFLPVPPKRVIPDDPPNRRCTLLNSFILFSDSFLFAFSDSDFFFSSFSEGLALFPLWQTPPSFSYNDSFLFSSVLVHPFFSCLDFLPFSHWFFFPHSFYSSP